ncbi:flagellin lysine-N-methylase [uncultured Megasphaera sp.]|uniref:flagellin lysine-N-methylase n=1 Tax=uncultured Megasphaera sp. TaxID=165188 RepID=UPI0025E3E4B6|nr:flagellin lysine-N-methylase [uncultured Megasphaera sp.]
MIIPYFYTDFRCKAGDCRHTCCRGWEIDIDEDTAAYYHELQGPLGEAIRSHIEKGDDAWHFILTKDEACPFLRTDGLCRLIREGGEDLLCQICRLHPRFFEVVTDKDGRERELGGVGLACEAACELLLKEKGPLHFLDSDDPSAAWTLSDILTSLGYTLQADSLTYRPDTSKKRTDQLLTVLTETEPIDAAWTASLTALTKERPTEESLQASLRKDRPLYQRIYDYIFYRQLETFAGSSLEVLSRYAGRNTDFIALTAVASGHLPEALRRWSEQIEYDMDNVRLLQEAVLTGRL